MEEIVLSKKKNQTSLEISNTFHCNSYQNKESFIEIAKEKTKVLVKTLNGLQKFLPKASIFNWENSVMTCLFQKDHND